MKVCVDFDKSMIYSIITYYMLFIMGSSMNAFNDLDSKIKIKIPITITFDLCAALEFMHFINHSIFYATTKSISAFHCFYSFSPKIKSSQKQKILFQS